MAVGSHWLRFRCTGCGECCRRLRVPLTDADVVRLRDATGREPRDFIDWISSEAADLAGEPSSVVQLATGRRAMFLAQTEGACVFLAPTGLCGAYAGRPLNCQLYPFDPSFGRRGGLRRLRLLRNGPCPHELDGELAERQLWNLDRRRWRELANYHERVRTWNRKQTLRERLHRRAGSAEEFLSFLGL